MPKVAVSDLELTVVVDHGAEPVDVDQAVAKFLLRLVRKQSRSPLTPPAAAVGFSPTPEAERQTPC